VIANIVKKEFSWLQKFADALIEWGEKDIFLSLSVKDLVWGYDEPLINKTVTLLNSFGVHLNISDKFGLFVGVRYTDFIDFLSTV